MMRVAAEEIVISHRGNAVRLRPSLRAACILETRYIRAHLLADAATTDLVPADHIRAGAIRPDKLPAIMIANGTTTMHGHAAGAQFVATVFIDLHLWAIEDGLDTVKTIGAAVARRLMDWPVTAGQGFELDGFKHQRTVYPRDPDPQFGHGVVFIEATLRWTI